MVHSLKISTFCSLSIFLLLIFCSAFSNAQQPVVRGIITDQHGVPVPGVTIKEEGTDFATISFSDGYFQFEPENKNAVLIFLKNGYSTQRIAVTGSQELVQVTLIHEEKQAFVSVSDTIDFNYFRWKQDNISFSFSSGIPKDFESSELSTAGILEKFSGANVQKNNDLPGGGLSVNIRGIESQVSDQPLYIVDGVVLNSGLNLPAGFVAPDPLFYVNASDVAEIKILKSGAATAIYGSRGANGVILINTKRGEKGSVKLNYNALVGIHVQENNISLLGGNEYFDLLDQSLITAGGEPLRINRSFDSKNWIDKSINTGIFTDHTLSVSGGGKKMNYYLSGNVLFNRGVVEGTGIKTGRLQFNNSFQATKWLNFKLNLAFGQATQKAAVYSDNYFSRSNPLVYAEIYPPIHQSEVSQINRLNNVFGNADPLQFIANALAENTGSQFLGNFSLNVRLLPNLTFHSSASGNYNDFGQTYNSHWVGQEYEFKGLQYRKYQTGNIYNWQVSNYFSYEDLEGEHQWSFLLGSEENYLKAKSQNSFWQNAGLAETTDAGFYLEGKNSKRVSAFYARAGYAFRQTLDVNAVFRREKLLRQNGQDLFGIFPSFSAGIWLYQNENDSQSFLSALKFNLGWGIPGAANFRCLNYDVLSQLPAQFGISPVSEPVVANARWETTEEWNFGILSRWFGSDMQLELQYFDRVREHVAFLNRQPESIQTGRWYNSARIYNPGFEIDLNYKKDLGDFGIFGEMSILTTKNKVLDLGDEFQGASNFYYLGNSNVPVSILKEGAETGSFWGYKMAGIFQTPEEIEVLNSYDDNTDTYYQNENTAPGDIEFEDLNNDGKIDENDMTIVGSPNPDFTYKILFGAIYKRFDFSLLFDGSHGNEIYNLNQMITHASGGWGNRAAEMYRVSLPEAAVYEMPRVHFNDPNQNARPNSGMVENGSFFRLNKLDVGYKFVINGTKATRAFISLQNLSLSSNPNGNAAALSSLLNLPGVNYGFSPASATILAGINISF